MKLKEVDLLDIDQVHAAITAANLQNPMQALYPPAWDAQDIEEQAFEAKRDALIVEIQSSPQELLERLGYSDEFNTQLAAALLACLSAGEQEQATSLIDSIKSILIKLIEQRAILEATKWIEG